MAGKIIFKEYDSIREIEPFLWKSLSTTGSYQEEYDFSLLLENSKIPGVSYKYLLAMRNNIFFFKIALCIFELKCLSYLPHRLRSLLMPLETYNTRYHKIKTLTTQGFFFNSSLPLCLKSIIEPEHPHMIGDLFDKIRDIARREKALFILFSARELRSDIVPSSFKSFAGPSHSVLRIDERWTSFYDYILAMRAGYRKIARNKINRFSSLGLKISKAATKDMPYKTAYAFYANIMRKHSHERRENHLLTEDFFKNLSLLETEDIFYFKVEKNDRLLGYILCTIDHEKQLSLEYFGLDRDCSDTSIYFNLIYTAIRYAIENGFRKIDFGVGHSETKLNLGAQSKRLILYLSAATPLASTAVNLFYKLNTLSFVCETEHMATNRNVFNKDFQSCS